MVRKYLFFITSKRAVLKIKETVAILGKKFQLSFVYLSANKATYAKEIYLTEFFSSSCLYKLNQNLRVATTLPHDGIVFYLYHLLFSKMFICN